MLTLAYATHRSNACAIRPMFGALLKRDFGAVKTLTRILGEDEGNPYAAMLLDDFGNKDL